MYARIVRDLDGHDLEPEWDALAVECARPYGAPGWQLGWWRAAAPPRARPLLLLASDPAGLAGVLALWTYWTRSGVHRARVMAAPLAQNAGPLARPDQRREAARSFAQALTQVRPRVATLEFEGVLDGEEWARLLVEEWPGLLRPHWRHDKEVAAPLAHLTTGGVDDWLATRSSNFRQQVRRSRRALLDQGGTFRRATTSEEIAAVVPELLALHHGRWVDRGGSRVVDALTEPALLAAGELLGGPDGRMHVEVIELGGRTISAHLFVTAGAEMTYWLGGFDNAFSSYRPGIVALLNAVEFALERGVQRLDLGPGRRPYKSRFTDDERQLAWGRLLLPGPQRPFTRLQLAPGLAARAARARLASSGVAAAAG